LRLLDDPRIETTAKWAGRPTMRWSIPTREASTEKGHFPAWQANRCSC